MATTKSRASERYAYRVIFPIPHEKPTPTADTVIVIKKPHCHSAVSDVEKFASRTGVAVRQMKWACSGGFYNNSPIAAVAISS